jgi:DNA-binding transcriptional LysR family regulator
MQAEIAQGRLVAVKLHAPELQRPVGVLHHRRKKFNAATRAFLDLLLAPDEVEAGGAVQTL